MDAHSRCGGMGLDVKQPFPKSDIAHETHATRSTYKGHRSGWYMPILGLFFWLYDALQEGRAYDTMAHYRDTHMCSTHTKQLMACLGVLGGLVFPSARKRATKTCFAGLRFS